VRAIVGDFLSSVKAVTATTMPIGAVIPKRGSIAPLATSLVVRHRLSPASRNARCTATAKRDRAKHAQAEERLSYARTGNTQPLSVLAPSAMEHWSQSLSCHPRISGIGVFLMFSTIPE
jgi:hypothetical protein